MTRKKQYITSAIVLACFPPLMILAHETGHYSVDKFLGYQPEFRYADVFIPTPRGISDSHLAWISLAGPLVEVLMTVIGLLWHFRNYHVERGARGISLWIFTALSLAGLRWLKVIFDGRLSDEAGLSAMAGWHHLTLPMMALPLTFLSGGAVFFFHRMQETLLPLGAGFCSGIISLLFWFSGVGPALLPSPEASNQAVGANRRPAGSATVPPEAKTKGAIERSLPAPDGSP